MLSYSVRFPTAAIEKRFEKALEDVFPASLRTEIIRKVTHLAHEPRPHAHPKIKPPVYVYNYAAQYRLRVGDYRVLYDVDDTVKTVWVLALRRRGEDTYL